MLIAAVSQLYGPKPLWITEYGYQTKPPDPQFGVSWANQARYLTQAFAIARKNPRIDLMLWFLVRDEPNLAGWQSGLMTADGGQEAGVQRVPAPAAVSADRSLALEQVAVEPSTSSIRRSTA